MDDDEVKVLLNRILNILPTLATKADIAAVNARIDALDARLSARIDALDARIVALAADIAVLHTGQAVLSGRLDEQRHILAALIPTQLAAVPRAAA